MRQWEGLDPKHRRAKLATGRNLTLLPPKQKKQWPQRQQEGNNGERRIQVSLNQRLWFSMSREERFQLKSVSSVVYRAVKYA